MAETQTDIKVGTFCWTELLTPNVEAAKKFYSELIGWKTTEEDMGGASYTFLTTPDGEQVGGMMQMDGPQWEGIPPHWMPYIMVENLDDSAQKVTDLGGKVKVPPTDIPPGRFCVIEDPTGAAIALFQSSSPGG